MDIETVGPLDIQHWFAIFYQEPVGDVPIDSGNQKADSNAINKNNPKNKFNETDEVQLHHHTEHNRANYQIEFQLKK